MQVPSGILVQIKGNGSLGLEEACMAGLAEQRGVAVFRASEKQVERGKFRLSDGVVALSLS